VKLDSKHVLKINHLSDREVDPESIPKKHLLGQSAAATAWAPRTGTRNAWRRRNATDNFRTSRAKTWLMLGYSLRTIEAKEFRSTNLVQAGDAGRPTRWPCLMKPVLRCLRLTKSLQRSGRLYVGRILRPVRTGRVSFAS
jgi:hypothetical protein